MQLFGKAEQLRVVVKKTTTGYAGGHKKFHLWVKKKTSDDRVKSGSPTGNRRDQRRLSKRIKQL